MAYIESLELTEERAYCATCDRFRDEAARPVERT
jgi:hypothetical protein